MPISFQCTNCQSIYNVQDGFAGKRVRCKCGAELIIPSPVAPAKPAASSANALPPIPSSGIVDLLSEPFPVADGSLPSGMDPLNQGPALESVRPRRRAKSKLNPQVWYAIGGGSAGIIVLVLIISAFSGGLPFTGPGEPGFETPEEACNAWVKATRNQDAKLLWNCLRPSARTSAVAVLLSQVSQFAPKDDRLAQILYDYDIKPGRASLHTGEAQAMAEKIEDQRGFFIRASKAVNKFTKSYLQEVMPPEVRRAANSGVTPDFKAENWDIREDTATADLVARTSLSEMKTRIAFVREDGRWYVR